MTVNKITHTILDDDNFELPAFPTTPGVELDGTTRRVLEIVKDLGISYRKFALKTGISAATIRSHFLRGTSLSVQALRRVKTLYPQYELEWLVFGTEPKFVSGYIHIAPPKATQEPEPEVQVQPEQTAHYNANIAYVVSGEMEEMPKLPILPSDAPKVAQVKLYSGAASAGHGAWAFNANNVLGTITCANACAGDIAISVEGDSMEPRISDGDILVMRERSSLAGLEPGKIYVIATDDEIYVKCIGNVYDNALLLHSLNPLYNDFRVEGDTVRKIFNVVRVITPSSNRRV